ncbi:MAG: chemoreceptor glutamine deamidase CheD [Nitrospira sp.]|nr:chemoreceptor glutamine deamidase CheD [Nitrospira sp.]
MRDGRFPHEIASILPGEFFVSIEPMVVYTVLGSCIAACIRDPVAGVGGMNHFMLPEPKGQSSSDWGEPTRYGSFAMESLGGMNHFMLPEPKGQSSSDWGEPTRYGSFAMESLINGILKRGGVRSRLEVKLFGAGKIYDGNIDVGANNAVWVTQYLASEGLAVVKSDLGDVFPRKVYYFTESGRVLMKKIERLRNRTIADRESEYRVRIKQREEQPAEDVTLF